MGGTRLRQVPATIQGSRGSDWSSPIAPRGKQQPGIVSHRKRSIETQTAVLRRQSPQVLVIIDVASATDAGLDYGRF